jgi:hypothetical protein
MYDPYQVAEARALGADCILIIMASVEDAQAAELEDAATGWGMDALIEVHDAANWTAPPRSNRPLIGINNRNLNTFETTLDTTRGWRAGARRPDDRLRKRAVPPGRSRRPGPLRRALLPDRRKPDAAGRCRRRDPRAAADPLMAGGA